MSADRLRPHRLQPSARAFLAGKVRTLMPMICYMLAYLLCFMLIENWNRLHYTVIHTAVDDLIPFYPVFVIPYLMWFPYVIFSSLLLLFKNEKAYHQLCSVLSIGMTIFILVSVIFPNIHLMRPEVMPDNSVFSKLVSLLYTIDTPTNLTPSIHVYNSLAVVAAVWKWDWRTDSGHVYPEAVKAFWRTILTIIGLLISLSTMLIKQHSFEDVVIATVLFSVIYLLVYRFDVLVLGGSGRVRLPALRLRSARS